MTMPAPQELAQLDYVTVIVGEQMFGLPIKMVHDVFVANNLTQVPLAPPQVIGLLNLRGRVVTAICLRCLLDLPPRDADQMTEELMALGIEMGGEAYGLIVDSIGEVLRFDAASLEPVPVHLDAKWSRISTGIHRLDEGILITLNIQSLLDFPLHIAA